MLTLSRFVFLSSQVPLSRFRSPCSSAYWFYASLALPLAALGSEPSKPHSTDFPVKIRSHRFLQPSSTDYWLLATDYSDYAIGYLYLHLRKEVIQPHLPIRLPCYDFTPVTGLTFDCCPLAVGLQASGAPNSHGVTGGVYKARERIHRDVLIRDY